VCVSVIHNTAQNSSDNLPSYLPDNHDCSDDVYWKERGSITDRNALTPTKNMPNFITLNYYTNNYNNALTSWQFAGPRQRWHQR